MAGFDNDTMYATNVDFSGSTSPAPTVTLNGQLLIGSTAAPNIRVGTLTAGAGITITNGAGSIQIAATGGVTPVGGLVPDAHTAPGTTPVVGDGSGNITITGAQVASGVVGTNVIRTDSLAANTMTIEIQRSTTAAASTPASNGVAHFDSSVFTVGAGGFVGLVGGAVPPTQKFNVDANTAPGTDPVVADASGIVTVTGAQVAAGTVGANVIRTDSLAANTYTIEVQRATTAAASTLASNGVSHYDSSIFTVGAGGFVSLVGGAVPPAQKFNVDTSTPPGTDPVVADASGIVTITGGQVATGTIGTNVIRTNSTAANAYAIEIQRSTAVVGTDPTKNGVCHFNSAQFTVDANGFVSSTGGGGTGTLIQQIRTSTAVYSAIGTVIPYDDTIPQITEGTEILSLSITPTNAASILVFDLSVLTGSNSSNTFGSFAIFQGGTTNALYAVSERYEDSSRITNVCGKYYQVAGTTSPITFSVRAGSSAGGLIVYINGSNSGRKFGGVGISSFYVSEFSA